jgi:penicillin-binding protein 1A
VLRVRDRDGNVLEENAPVPLPAVAHDGSAASPDAVADAALAQRAALSDPTPPATEEPGNVVLDAPPPPPPPFTIPAEGTRPDVAFVLTAMMRGVVDQGTGVAARALGRPAAAKTGTAQEHRDAWFVGFTPELVAGVWVGFDDHAPLGPRETGAGAALPPWLSFMQAALGSAPPAAFELVPGVELARIDPATGLLAPEGQADALVAAFLAGTAPSESAEKGPGTAPQNFFMDDR